MITRSPGGGAGRNLSRRPAQPTRGRARGRWRRRRRTSRSSTTTSKTSLTELPNYSPRLLEIPSVYLASQRLFILIDSQSETNPLILKSAPRNIIYLRHLSAAYKAVTNKDTLHIYKAVNNKDTLHIKQYSIRTRWM